MIQINEITAEPKQRHLLTIEGYERAALTLEYMPSQYGWFYSVVWGTFEIYNQRVTFSHNMLRQFKESLPFGIAVTTTNNQDPMTRDAFSTGIASLYVLTAADIAEMEAHLYG